MSKDTEEEKARLAEWKKRKAESDKKYKAVEAALRDRYPLIDLTEITRDSSRMRAVVYLVPEDTFEGPSMIEWIKLGQVQLDLRERTQTWVLRSYLAKSATDFEHDSAYALQLGLIGLHFESVRYHTSTFKAWVHPSSSDDFRVPPPGYNPLSGPKVTTCKQYPACKKDPHPMLPEGSYVPERNLDLYKKVRGMSVEIQVGPVFLNEE